MNHLKINSKNSTKGKKYIIPDIHGCYDTLRALIHKIDLQKQDHLFLLGDYINRGPKSKEVVDFVIQLMNDGYKVHPLKGNHEQVAQTGQGLNTYNMNNPNGSPMYRYVDFFEKLFYYIELEDTFLVHAGFNFNKENPFEDIETMLWAKRNFQRTNPKPDKRVIYGHNRTSLDRIQTAIKNRDLWIPLDNGCYQKNRPQFGNLCCLELNGFELTIQENVDEMEDWKGIVPRLNNS